MAEVDTELNGLFASHNASLPPELLGELQSILRIHSSTPQELFYKWESYSMKMGADTRLDLRTTRDFKKDLQDVLERESRTKSHVRSVDKRGHGATPRTISKTTNGDVFGMMEGIVPGTPRSPMNGVNGNSQKRKGGTFETPLAAKTSKLNVFSSPGGEATPTQEVAIGKEVPFSQRPNAGQVVESLNSHIQHADISTTIAASEPRIKVKANTDLTKFSYKPMAMKLSEASEILDDRIDSFLDLLQAHDNLDDSAFGNPASQSTNEIIAVGRIASDTLEGKLNSASVVLETSRRTGAGLRIPLKLDKISSYDIFPGKIVALRGSNASGDYFDVSEMLKLPLPPAAATTISDLDAISAKLGHEEFEPEPTPLAILVSSGPYTTDSNLLYESLHALCEQAKSTQADALILVGPFLDIEHPLLSSGDIPTSVLSSLPNPDTATAIDLFRHLISTPLQQLCAALPTLTIILAPSIRDLISRHVSWPQDRLGNRKELGLPKQVAMVTNPVTIALNETVIAISAQDVLYELRREECIAGVQPAESRDMLARLSRDLIEQRHFFPLFPPTNKDNLPKPTASALDGDGDVNADADADATSVRATGAMLDTSYLALAEFQHVRPDILITPSALPPFAKVVESVVVINPGTVSKKRGAGTFARMTVARRDVTGDERGLEAEAGQDGAKLVPHLIFERARVDVVRI
jgi:DNA polymerase alpha subunit B